MNYTNEQLKAIIKEEIKEAKRGRMKQVKCENCGALNSEKSLNCRICNHYVKGTTYEITKEGECIWIKEI